MQLLIDWSSFECEIDSIRHQLTRSNRFALMLESNEREREERKEPIEKNEKKQKLIFYGFFTFLSNKYIYIYRKEKNNTHLKKERERECFLSHPDIILHFFPYFINNLIFLSLFVHSSINATTLVIVVCIWHLNLSIATSLYGFI